MGSCKAVAGSSGPSCRAPLTVLCSCQASLWQTVEVASGSWQEGYRWVRLWGEKEAAECTVTATLPFQALLLLWMAWFPCKELVPSRQDGYASIVQMRETEKVTGHSYWSWRINRLQDGVSPASEEEETFSCHSRGAAALDPDVGFYP